MERNRFKYRDVVQRSLATHLELQCDKHKNINLNTLEVLFVGYTDDAVGLYYWGPYTVPQALHLLIDGAPLNLEDLVNGYDMSLAAGVVVRKKK